MSDISPLERLHNLEFAAYEGHGDEHVLLPQGVLTVINNSAPDVPWRNCNWVYQWADELHGRSKVIPRETAVGLLAWKWSTPWEMEV